MGEMKTCLSCVGGVVEASSLRRCYFAQIEELGKEVHKVEVFQLELKRNVVFLFK
jgi:hypothetical protein